MQRGDLVRLKKISGTIFGHNGCAVIFSDQQLHRLEILAQGELSSLYSKDKNHALFKFNEFAIIIGEKNIIKNSTTWNSFVKVITNSGIVGWISKDHLIHVFKK